MAGRPRTFGLPNGAGLVLALTALTMSVASVVAFRDDGPAPEAAVTVRAPEATPSTTSTSEVGPGLLVGAPSATDEIAVATSTTAPPSPTTVARTTPSTSATSTTVAPRHTSLVASAAGLYVVDTEAVDPTLRPIWATPRPRGLGVGYCRSARSIWWGEGLDVQSVPIAGGVATTAFRLTPTTGEPADWHVLDCAVAPDDSRIFLHWAQITDDDTGESHAAVFDTDGTELYPLCAQFGPRSLLSAGAFSPDSTRFAAPCHGDGLASQVVVAATGALAPGTVAPLPTHGVDAPDWSPDGRLLLLRHGPLPSVVLDPADGHLTPLDTFAGRVRWIDDVELIGLRWGGGAPPVVLSRAAIGGPLRDTAIPATDEFVPDPAGERLACLTIRSTRVVDRRGSAVLDVDPIGGRLSVWPRGWSADGRWLVILVTDAVD